MEALDAQTLVYFYLKTLDLQSSLMEKTLGGIQINVTLVIT